MQDARQRLQSYTRQPLLLFSLIDTRHALIIGQKSLFEEAMDQLGIRNAAGANRLLGHGGGGD